MTTVTTEESRYPVYLRPEDFDELVHGADWHWAFQLFEDDGVTPKDITSWSCDIYLLESENGEEYAHLTTSSGITITTASGLINVDISDTTIDTYNFRSCVFKVIVKDDTGDKKPYFIGRLSFAQV